jgi:hypothetical protein
MKGTAKVKIKLAITISLWDYDLGGYPNAFSINPRYVSTEFCNGSFGLLNINGKKICFLIIIV